MTEFEQKALAALETLTRQLDFIRSDIRWLRDREQSKVDNVTRMVEEARAQMPQMPKPPGR